MVAVLTVVQLKRLFAVSSRTTPGVRGDTTDVLSVPSTVMLGILVLSAVPVGSEMTGLRYGTNRGASLSTADGVEAGVVTREGTDLRLTAL